MGFVYTELLSSVPELHGPTAMAVHFMIFDHHWLDSPKSQAESKAESSPTLLRTLREAPQIYISTDT